MEDDSKHSSSSWSPARIQAALDEAVKLREAGNQAFRSRDYKHSTETYSRASHSILHLRSLHHLGTAPLDQGTFAARITELQFLTSSNEAASWLKYEGYDGQVSRFRKALDSTRTAEQALKEHPGAWSPSDAAMGKLLYRRAVACEGLGDYDGASRALEEAKALRIGDPAVCRLAAKVSDIRMYGKEFVEDGFVPWPRSVEAQLGPAGVEM